MKTIVKLYKKKNTFLKKKKSNRRTTVRNVTSYYDNPYQMWFE